MTQKRSQVTTKRGDQGETTALSGEHYSKSHPIMECTGAVDELRAQTALARLLVIDQAGPHCGEIGDFLFWLLHAYFLIGTACSDPRNLHPEYRHDCIGPLHLDKLEAFQTHLEQRVTLPHAFIVSAATTVSAHMDIAASVARRLERNLVRLKESVPEFDITHLYPFVNRLSDTLFMLARLLDGGEYQTVDYGVLSRDIP